MMTEQINQPEIKLAHGGSTSALIGSILVLIAILGFVFYVKPLSSEVGVANDSVVAKEMELDGIKVQLDTYSKAEADLNLTTDVKKQEVLNAIPAGLDQDRVIEDLIKIADEYKVSLRSISFNRGSSEVPGISVLRISSSFEGNYSDLTSFLRGIEQNGRLFKVENIAVQVKKVDISDIERANFSLSIAAFYQDTN